MVGQSPKGQFAANAVYGVFFLGMMLYATYVFAMSTGMTGVTHKNGFGCTCHNPSPSTGVTVTINGPAELSANQTAQYTVTIQGGPAVRAGTNIAASDGVLSPGSSALQTIGDELTHTAPRAFENGVATFSFNYTAPATPGTYTMYANGNSVNFNGDNTGDQWNFAPDKKLTVKAVTAVGRSAEIPDGFTLAQNYPNPFNPSTAFSYQLSAVSHVSLKVFDLLGREIATLVNGTLSAGAHTIQWDASTHPSGVYMYRLEVNGASQTKKMVLTK